MDERQLSEVEDDRRQLLEEAGLNGPHSMHLARGDVTNSSIGLLSRPVSWRITSARMSRSGYTKMSNPLPIPESAERDPRSVEMVRAWIAEGDLFVVLNVGFWEKPERGIDEREAWGLLMADMARHIANAHEEEYGRNIRDSLDVIREAFEREMMKPTSSHSGQFADD